MSKKEDFDAVYTRPGEAVWTMPVPPAKLLQFMNLNLLRPGSKILDIACGEGVSAVYMDSRGHDVTGIDFHAKAITWARQRADRYHSHARFLLMDVLDLDRVADTFDFVFEWGLIHHLDHDDVARHIVNVQNWLVSCGYYMSMCFSSEDPAYPQHGRTTFKTRLGTELRYHTLEEMRRLFQVAFSIIAAERIRVEGKGVWHPGTYFLLRKKW